MSLFRKRNALLLVLPVLHLGVCLLLAFGPGTGASTHAGGWNWFPLFLLDFPASILLMRLDLMVNQPALIFAIGGTLWWLLISIVLMWLFRGVAWCVRRAFGRSGTASLLLLFILLLTTAARAQNCDALSGDARWRCFQQQELKAWAKRIAVSPETFSRALRVIGRRLGDAEDKWTLENAQLFAVGHANFLLLSIWDEGTGHCLSVDLLKPTGTSFKQFQTLTDPSHGGEICTESLAGPARAIEKNGRIVISAPGLSGPPPDDSTESPRDLEVQTFAWNGREFVVRDTKNFSNFRWNGREYVPIGRPQPQ